MKRIIIAILICLTGMTVFAQGRDMSYFIEELNSPIATSLSRLEVLEVVRDANITGIGEFYHDVLRMLITRLPDIRTGDERDNVEASVSIVARGLGAEEYLPAASDLWHIVEFADTIYAVNDGFLMQDALIALGQIDAVNFVPHIVQRLNDFNISVSSDAETRRRVQRAVVGCISALEALAQPEGYRPVFFASMGWYDVAIRNIASAALPNILEDPADVIIEIIRDPSIVPAIKYEALMAMLTSQAPDESKARVASAALATGWTQLSAGIANQTIMREMRMAAIDTIRDLGAADDSVYVNLRRSYNNNFINPVPDFDEIRRTISALSALATDEAVEILLDFLRELHTRRRLGPWGTNRERQIFGWVLAGIGSTGTQSADVRSLLMTIERSQDYTGAEQGWARDALRRLGQ